MIGEQAVAYILDDVYVPRLDFLKPGFLDLAQVEVMKGPQGTLYGRNATGGVIKIEHGTPSQEWEGYLTAERGDRDLRSYEMALGGPINDDWSFRIAGRKANDGGFVENTVTGGNSREKDIEQARFSIRGDLSEKLTLDASYYHLDYFIGAFVGDEIHKYPDGLRPLADSLTPNFEANLDRKNANSGQNESIGKGYIAPIKLTYEALDYTYNYVLGLVALDDSIKADVEGQSADVATLLIDQEFSQISHELRVVSPPGKFQYVVGAFYLETALEANINVPIYGGFLPFVEVLGISPDDLGLGGLLGSVTDLALNQSGGAISNLYGEFSVDVESYGIFSQAEWRITDNFLLTMGLRYSSDTKDGTALVTDTGPLPVWDALIQGGYTADDTLSYKDFSPKVSLSWEPTDNITAYATYAQGYRAGSFNVAAFSKDKYIFDAETSDTYEAGVKTSLFDDLARMNLGVFLTNYGGYQLATLTGVTYTQSNAKEVETKGVEADFTFLLAEGFMINGNVGYNETLFVDFQDAACPAEAPGEPGYQLEGPVTLPPSPQCDLSGRGLHRAPKLTGSIGFSYESQLFTLPLVGFVSADANFKDAEYMDADLDPDDYQEAYWLYNARVGLKPISDSWRIEVHVKNISDELVKTFSGDLPLQAGAHWALTNPPRTVHATFRVSF
ncbi:TonB-dependent receptor [Zhongshania aliphaticivorans]|uniref:TonB-dependent receptor n=1 Tax=Zhongshania aliphaticivorans TaxID=1470434 RepID=UPI0039C9AEAB